MYQLILIFLFALMYGTFGFAQTFTQITDIHVTGDAQPDNIIVYNQNLMFTAKDSSGHENWYQIDVGTTNAVKVSDFSSAGGCGGIYEPVLFKNHLFFIAYTSSFGSELWYYDGSSVQLLKDIDPGTKHGIDESNLALHNNELYFIGTEPSTGRELWKTDGTQAGTKLIKDINPGSSGSFGIYIQMISFNGFLYFPMFDSNNGRELWVSDGTTLGTKLFLDIEPGTNSSNPTAFKVLNNMLFFVCETSQYGKELWHTDGTTLGTSILKDINVGPGTSYPVYYPDLTESGGLYFFLASDDGVDVELWKTDGTFAGTKLFKNLNPFGASHPLVLTDIYGTLYFNATSSIYGGELWRSDGTIQGTYLVKDINPSGSSNPNNFIEYNGRVYFSANDDLGRRLFKINPFNDSISIMQPQIAPINNALKYGATLTVWEDALYFAAHYNTQGRELWRMATTPSSIALVNQYKHVSVYPNPATNSLIIDLLEQPDLVKVYDILGKKMFEVENEKHIDISQLNSGIYLIEITINDTGYHSNFIKD